MLYKITRASHTEMWGKKAMSATVILFGGKKNTHTQEKRGKNYCHSRRINAQMQSVVLYYCSNVFTQPKEKQFNTRHKHKQKNNEYQRVRKKNMKRQNVASEREYPSFGLIIWKSVIVCRTIPLSK